MIKEFKEFIAKGNVMDAAIGFVLGLAFKAIVDSVVNGLLMPIVGLLTSGYDLSAWKIVLRQAEGETPEAALLLGTIIQTVISFVIIAFFLFLVVKALNAARNRRQKEEAVVEEAAPAEDIVLLTQIRDLLEQNKLPRA